jgi:hypothetical protein
MAINFFRPNRASNIIGAGLDLKRLGNAGTNFGQRFASGVGALSGTLGGGYLPELNISENLYNYFAPKAGASGTADAGVAGEEGAYQDTAGTDTTAETKTLGNAIVEQLGSGGGAGGATALEDRQRLIFNGRDYGFADDSGARMNYFNDVNADAVGQADFTLGRFMEDNEKSKGNLDYNRKRALEQLESRKKEIQLQRENYFKEAEKQGQQFVDDKMLGDVNRGVGFGRRSSNAFQSSQATSQDFADKKLMEGLAEQESAKKQTDDSFTNYFSELDKTNLDQQRQYEQDLSGLSRAEADAKFMRDNFVNQSRSQYAGNLAPLDLKQGITDFSSRYQLQPFSNVNTVQADTSKYQPVTTFQGGEFASSGSGPSKLLKPGTTDPLDEFYGYKPDEREKNYFQDYMQGAY